MKIIDSTYLRTVHDGLLSGAVHKDNASALPMGLVGMYEEALPPGSNVKERRKFMDFFMVWALLKKEVSAGFVSALLEGWTEDEVLDFISRFSKWFNSPVGGTYVLYHERLRAFVVEKASHAQFLSCNEALIQQCEAALLRREGDEWERYALEHLSAHMLLPAMELGDAGALRTLAYNTAHWNRQVEISKGFGWTKRMLNDMELWASKHDEDEVIECLLNKVDLHHIEQNDGPRIVALVAQNDIDTALQRIESFGGNDEEGLKRKFLLYMLCLMELTLLDSKDAPFRKEAIGRLLKHLDDNLPVDDAELDWMLFFPSDFVFMMACEWAGMGLDYSVVYHRTNSWDSEWIPKKGPFENLQFEVFFGWAKAIRDYSAWVSAMHCIAVELTKKGKIAEALRCVQDTENEDRCRILAGISTALAQRGQTAEAASVLLEALTCARGISSDTAKSNALKYAATALAQQGNVDEALSHARAIVDEEVKGCALEDISTALAGQGKLDEARVCADEIKEPQHHHKGRALRVISVHLVRQGKGAEALECASGIRSTEEKNNVFEELSIEFVRRGKVEEALACVSVISDDEWKSGQLKDISAELAKQGELEKALVCARGIVDDYWKSAALGEIATALTKLGEEVEAASTMQQALRCARGISNDAIKCAALAAISSELAQQGKVDDAASEMKEALTCAMDISTDRLKCSALIPISTALAKQGKVVEALACAKSISDDFWKGQMLKDISETLAKQGTLGVAAHAMILRESLFVTTNLLGMSEKEIMLSNILTAKTKQGDAEDALACAMAICDENWKSSVLKDISTTLAQQGRADAAASVMQDALTSARGISNDYLKTNALKDIATALAEQGRLEEAMACARDIGDESDKCTALMEISTVLVEQGKLDEALACAMGISDESDMCTALRDISHALVEQGRFDEALASASGISDDSEKSNALKNISTALAKQGKLEEALACARDISSDRAKDCALTNISTELVKQGKLDEALACARDISSDREKSEALKEICIELAKQGKAEDAFDCSLDIEYYDTEIRALIAMSCVLFKQGMADDAALAMQDAIAGAERFAEDQDFYNQLLSEVFEELVEQGDWTLAKRIDLNMTSAETRQRCWQQVGRKSYNNLGWQLTLNFVCQIENAQARSFCFRGLVDSAVPMETSKAHILSARRFFQEDVESLEKLLLHYSLRELFFFQCEKSKLERFDRTLNLQWAVDVRNGGK